MFVQQEMLSEIIRLPDFFFSYMGFLSNDTEDSFWGVKRPGREADHSPQPSAEVKNAWSYISTPEYVFMAWYLIKHKDDFIFALPFHVVWCVLS
jgi:hypothetical protein